MLLCWWWWWWWTIRQLRLARLQFFRTTKWKSDYCVLATLRMEIHPILSPLSCDYTFIISSVPISATIYPASALYRERGYLFFLSTRVRPRSFILPESYGLCNVDFRVGNSRSGLLSISSSVSESPHLSTARCLLSRRMYVSPHHGYSNSVCS